MTDTTAAIRLKHFLDYLGISNSQFADSCGIPRPTLSQLLSGRNKKLSDQVLRPIHEHFPNLSIVWLMFGEGDMLLRNEGVPESEMPFNSGAMKDELYETHSHLRQPPFSAEGEKPIDFVDESEYIDNKQCNTVTEIDSRTSNNDISSAAKKRDVTSPLPPYVRQSIGERGILPSLRKVKSIVVYYDDNTYETFTPDS